MTAWPKWSAFVLAVLVMAGMLMPSTRCLAKQATVTCCCCCNMDAMACDTGHPCKTDCPSMQTHGVQSTDKAAFQSPPLVARIPFSGVRIVYPLSLASTSREKLVVTTPIGGSPPLALLRVWRI